MFLEYFWRLHTFLSAISSERHEIGTKNYYTKVTPLTLCRTRNEKSEKKIASITQNIKKYYPNVCQGDLDN